MKKIFIILMLFTISFVLVSCDVEFHFNDTYQLSFETNGGTEIASTFVHDDFMIEDLEQYQTTRDGYKFDGWYTDETLTTLFSGSITETLTLYAKWIKVFTITFLDDDGLVLDVRDVEEGTIPTYEGTRPSKDSESDIYYIFSGWSPELKVVEEDYTYVATYRMTTMEETPFDGTDIDKVLGFDFYSEIPNLDTADYRIHDEGTSENIDLKIDVYDWNEAIADVYLNELNDMLYFDEQNDTWIAGDYTVSFYENDEDYPDTLVYTIYIYGAVQTYLDDWEDVTASLDAFFNFQSFSNLLPEVLYTKHIKLNQEGNEAIYDASSKTYQAIGVSTLINTLTSKGWSLDTDLTDQNGENVYTYIESSSRGFAIYYTYTELTISFKLWSFEIDEVTPSPVTSFINQETMNAFEINNFGVSGLPSEGTYDVLVIPIEVRSSRPNQDTSFPSNYLSQLELTFNGTPLETGWQSVSSFYTQSSYGKLNMHFDIVEKYTTLYTKNDYENDYGMDLDEAIISEAVNNNTLDSRIDYSKYDTNNDGALDSVIFIYSIDYDNEFQTNDNAWWAWVYDTRGWSTAVDDVDGKTLEYYMWASYAFLEDSIDGLYGLNVNAETYIHESGHLLAMPDLYSGTHVIGPLGDFDMMARNNADHGPFNKLMWGWVEPILANQGLYAYTIDAYATDDDGKNSVIMIPYRPSDLAGGNAFAEYLLIMFYTPEGLYEGHLNSSTGIEDAGIVIYHVNAVQPPNTYFWGNYFGYNNDGTSDFLIEILEADLDHSFPNDDIMWISEDIYLPSSPLTSEDLLRTGNLDLSNTYSWSNGNSINVSIEVGTTITNTSDDVTLYITIR